MVPSHDLLDEAIAKDIEKALERNFNVESEDVTVAVSGGVVVLSGSVRDWTA